MKTAITFTSLIASTLAEGYFGVMATRSASPIHFLPLNANGGKFYLGGTPSSFCPPQVGDVCKAYPGNSTVLAGGDGTLGLAVIVPGGQRAYIAPDGSMSYTVPHSAYIPEGSIVDGWTKEEGEAYGWLRYKDGLIACPPAEESKPWPVFGQRSNVTLSPDCLGFSALAFNSTKAGAWEY
ncbi:hypothetical protein K458DRAFT_294210 [Lentithecium fluviatile CBS 122367]|uniref:IgE-binding protein n=1 Tax=Lentithecium fluviatile CBS 122367 TaxID=1168545 RepID=A0A6G1JC68_9PLEO|nr:hypothetical protein K458DRAFT_294210 [Lentithecium fluviatile CBS 122367]